MASTNTQRVREIFEEAIELAEAERQAFLELACAGDSQLRSAVDRLIEAYVEDGCDNSKTHLQTPRVPHSSIKGKIGRFRVLQRIGEGGFGEVWMAEQLEPVKRRVAIKIIKPGMDSKQVIARFEAERQALAIMEHPNIARVYDGGETEEGRPYFVMELVSGEAISTYCASKHLDIPQRIELFRSVCSAVQHAHQKGIIHRDLKPSNVLVCEVNGKPVAKVIDFGIAKALERPLTDKTLFTEFQQMVGTPAYMSPEQASLSMIDVDTRSDVYSLGVLLYELLAGGPPFDPKSLRSAGFDEMRRIIREVEPPAPSVRLSGERTASDTDDLKSEADRDQRQRKVRGELDWIVQRAMAKERDRRYASASEFDDDLERYLNGDAVRAGPAGKWYRARRFMARNRVPLAVAGSVAAAIMVALLVLSVGLVVLNKSYRQLQVVELSERKVNKSLQKQLLLQGVVRANAQSKGNWDLARADLEKVDQSERTWLWRLLNARMPRDVTDRYSEVAEGYARLLDQADQRYDRNSPQYKIIDVSPAAKRAIVRFPKYTSGGPFSIELVSLESNPSEPIVLARYNAIPPDLSGQEISPRERYVDFARSRGGIGFQPGFCGDGSRVIVPPTCWLRSSSLQANWGARSDSDGYTFPVPANQIRIYSSVTGSLVAEIALPTQPAKGARPIELQEHLMQLSWATNASGTRLALAMGELMQVVDVSTGEVVWQHQLENGQAMFAGISMSPSGDRVAAAVDLTTRKKTGNSTMVRTSCRNILWARMHDDSTSDYSLLDSGGSVETIGFTDDGHLLVSTTQYKKLKDRNYLHKSLLNAYRDGQLIGSGYSCDHMPNMREEARILPSGSPSNVFFSINGILRHVNLVSGWEWDDVPDIDVPKVMVSVAESPGKNASGTLVIWNPRSKDCPARNLQTDETIRFVECAQPVAEVVRGSKGLLPSEAFWKWGGTFIEISSSVGVLELDTAEKVISVSPDSRYVYFASGVDKPYIADMRTGQRYALETRGRLYQADFLPWAEINGVPGLVTLDLPFTRPSSFPNLDYCIRSFDVRDGSLVHSIDVSLGDAVEALGLPTSLLSKVRHIEMSGIAVSPRGRFIALSGIYVGSHWNKEGLSKLERGLSVCMIIERESGEVVSARVLQEMMATNLVFSQDETQLAYISTAKLNRGECNGKISFMNVADVASKFARSDIDVVFDHTYNSAVPPPLLSFSKDGELLSFAGRNYVDLYDVDTATLVSRLEWPYIRDMLCKQPAGVTGSSDDLSHYLGIKDIQVSGAAFTADGNELRIGASSLSTTNQLGIIRIFDHPVMDAQVHATANHNSELTTSATPKSAPQEPLHAARHASEND